MRNAFLHFGCGGFREKENFSNFEKCQKQLNVTSVVINANLLIRLLKHTVQRLIQAWNMVKQISYQMKLLKI